MTTPELFDERAVLTAYLDAQRPAYPHDDFQKFRRAKLAAIEAAYQIRLSISGVDSRRPKALWMLFASTADSLLNLQGPRASMIDDSLITATIDRVDTPDLGLREIEGRLNLHLREAREAHLQLLVSLFKILWGPLEKYCTTEDLVRLGFDPSSEPQLADYFDQM